MPRYRTAYPPEFRRQMVDLVRSGRTPEELAREFEPTAHSISTWVKQAERDAGKRIDGPTSAEREELGRLRREKGSGLVLLNPDPDQVSTDVVALGEPIQGLAGQELLSHLALEFDAVRAVLGHGLPSFESPARWSILAGPTVRPKGPTPNPGSNLGGNRQPVFCGKLEVHNAAISR